MQTDFVGFDGQSRSEVDGINGRWGLDKSDKRFAHVAEYLNQLDVVFKSDYADAKGAKIAYAKSLTNPDEAKYAFLWISFQ